MTDAPALDRFSVTQSGRSRVAPDAASSGDRIKGWCPGALRPMRSGDGLIVRVRMRGGILDIGLAREMAAWARRWGNGQIELTGRANLQLRGLSETHLADLHGAMAQWNPLDSSPEGEAVRNVISSPLSGLDPSALLDIRPIVTALERRLAGDTTLHELPGKFGFAIDDGGQWGLSGVRTDVSFTAARVTASDANYPPGPAGNDRFRPKEPFSEGRGGSGFAIGPKASIGHDFEIGLGGHNTHFRCAPDTLVETAAAIARAFMARRRGHESQIRRMTHLVDRIGIDAIGREANLSRSAKARLSLSPGATTPPLVILGLDPRPNVLRSKQLPQTSVTSPANGLDPKLDDAMNRGPIPGPEHACPFILGIGFPFGSIGADDLAHLASAADAAGVRDLRLTPWRAVLAPVRSRGAANAIIASLPLDRFILDANDPRRRVAACPGAPACSHATTRVRDDAARIAQTTKRFVHVSGCEKGCAHSRPAAVTAVARDGRYDLVINGLASAAPVAAGLTAAELIAALKSAA